MNITGLDALVFGVDDLAACSRFLVDYGLADAGGGDGNAVAVDASGNAYVAGYTAWATFPVTVGAYDRSLAGDLDAFVAKIGPATPQITLASASVSTAATDLAGNALAKPELWKFTTDAQAAIGPAPVVLGAAGSYVILAKSAISNVPTSKITGDLALSPAPASYITGFSLTKAGTHWTTPEVIGSVFAADNDPPTPIDLTTAVGAMMTGIAAFAMAARTGHTVAELLPNAAYTRGHGANTVNVILVDIRAWDTLGEISVLLVAATGVASLVFRHHRFGTAPRITDTDQETDAA